MPLKLLSPVLSFLHTCEAGQCRTQTQDLVKEFQTVQNSAVLFRRLGSQGALGRLDG